MVLYFYLVTYESFKLTLNFTIYLDVNLWLNFSTYIRDYHGYLLKKNIGIPITRWHLALDVYLGLGVAIHVHVSGVVLTYEYSTIWVDTNSIHLLNGLRFFNSNTTRLLN